MSEIRNGDFVLSNTKHWHLVGDVYGDKRFPDGANIVTSRIISIHGIEKDVIVKTRNSEYLIKDFEKIITSDMIKTLEDSVDVVL